MKKQILKLVNTESRYAGLVMRVTLGLVIFPHGAQKLLGWFGGFGFSGTMQYFTGNGLPWIVALLVILGESLGALALIVGFFGRFMAMGIGIIMIGAIPMHVANGFFMNWMGQQKGEGYEYHLLALGLSIAIMLLGSGKFSCDQFLTKVLKKT